MDSAGVSGLMENMQIIKDYAELLWGLRGIRLGENLFSIRNSMASECIQSV